MRLMKRQSYDLAGEMLFFALSGVKKTNFIYACNLSSRICEKYISLLMGNGLLEKKGDYFHTTKKGIKYLETYQKLDSLWNTL